MGIITDVLMEQSFLDYINFYTINGLILIGIQM